MPERPVRGNLTLKVLGKEFEDDSPRGGEMSAKLTEGTASVRGTFLQKGFPPVNSPSDELALVAVFTFEE